MTTNIHFLIHFFKRAARGHDGSLVGGHGGFTNMGIYIHPYGGYSWEWAYGCIGGIRLGSSTILILCTGAMDQDCMGPS